MDKLRKLRAPERRSVTRFIGILEAGLVKEPISRIDLEVALQQLARHTEKLNNLDEQIKEALLEANASDEEFNAEYDAIKEYADRVADINVRVNTALPTQTTPECLRSERSFNDNTTLTPKSRNFKLPKVELRKFSGDLRDWLGWWAQFSKIDEDDSLHASDKFTYLSQAMVDGSRAKELVMSYPQSADNYPKVISALKTRYGNPKLLKQVYVRELIQMILCTRSKERRSLTSLYDRLESHLRSLESLGVTMEQMVEFLFPMVESVLPEDVLLAWQRSGNFAKDGSNKNPPKSEVDYLMEFLRTEIELEEQRKLARSGFNPLEKKLSRPKETCSTLEDSMSTAAGLFSGSAKHACIFCEKSHESNQCFKAQKMTLDEKRSKIQESKCCFRCLKSGHTAKLCKARLQCMGCGQRHSVVMCPELHRQKECTDVKIQANLNCTTDVVLRTLMVKLRNPKSDKTIIARVILDCGSQRTHILYKLAQKLSLESTKNVTVSHQLFGGKEIRNQQHKLYQLIICSLTDNSALPVIAMGQSVLCAPVPRVSKGLWQVSLEKCGIVINDLDNSKPAEIALLLGADFLGRIITGKVKQLENGLTLTETTLGWTVMGQQPPEDNIGLSTITMTITTSSVAELWKLDTIGILDPIEVRTIDERNVELRAQFLRTVTRNTTGRYGVSLPWADNPVSIPINFEIAKKRLERTTQRLNELGKLQEYHAVFIRWENEGIITRVTECSRSGHYLPHRAVIKESKTTPVRPVFDASCKSLHHPSLNDMLMTGPNLLELIPQILMKFRMMSIGVIADIRKAFLQIEVCESDRNYQKFLWWEEPNNPKLIVYKHNRVMFGINCSPYLLSAVIQYHLSCIDDSRADTARKILQSIYVDNLVLSVENTHEYNKFKCEAINLMMDCQMDLNQWERSGEVGESEVTSVLGLRWNKIKDTIIYHNVRKQLGVPLTKRLMLSTIHQIFDPLGLLSPVLIVPKQLLQQAWKEDRSWDTEVSSRIQEEFLLWHSELDFLEKIEIPRAMTITASKRESNKQLHVFTDASQKSYAAAVFLRMECNGRISVQLVQAKSRVAPLKPVTIPRMELLGCTIGARLLCSIKKSFESDIPVYYWSDSSTAISWIRRTTQWGTFVSNRVKEIHLISDRSAWKFLPGHLNPADLPSRGTSPSKFKDSKWWEGPEWLRRPISEWPNECLVPDEQAIESEKKNSTQYRHHRNLI